MAGKGIHILGMPLFGVILPFTGRRRIPLNRDLTPVDTGESDILDEVGFYYVEPVVFEWLGNGLSLTKGVVHRTDTGEPVYDDEAAA